MKIGLQAMRIAIAGFIIPYMAVYAPVLMLQGGTPLEFAWVLFKALLGILLWGGAAIGYWLAPLGRIERIFAFVAAALLVAAVPATDELGIAMAAALGAWHLWRARLYRHRAAAAPTGARHS